VPYNGRRVINFKCTIFLFTFHFYLCADHVLHAHASVHKCHTRACIPHTCACAIYMRWSPYVRHTCTNKPERWCDMMWHFAWNKCRLWWLHARFSTYKSLIELFPWGDSIVKASGCVWCAVTGGVAFHSMNRTLSLSSSKEFLSNLQSLVILLT